VSSVPSVLSDSYDDVLAAVQESSRGRWFLDEYASRLRQNDSKAVLAAIQKLEETIGELPNARSAEQPATQDVQKMKRAIENIRRQIAAGSDGKPLSEEAQMFSHLADLARAAFNGQTNEVRPEIRSGIEMALRVVQDIENEIRGAKSHAEPEAAAQKQKPATETQKYFQQDADMFAPPAGKTTTATGDKPQNEEGAGKGARLKVLKIDSNATTKTNTTEATSAAATETSHTPISESTSSEQKPRITIIRRKPEDLMQVPLAEPEKAETAA
jgi:hypothetical protein